MVVAFGSRFPAALSPAVKTRPRRSSSTSAQMAGAPAGLGPLDLGPPPPPGFDSITPRDDAAGLSTTLTAVGLLSSSPGVLHQNSPAKVPTDALSSTPHSIRIALFADPGLCAVGTLKQHLRPCSASWPQTQMLSKGNLPALPPSGSLGATPSKYPRDASSAAGVIDGNGHLEALRRSRDAAPPKLHQRRPNRLLPLDMRAIRDTGEDAAGAPAAAVAHTGTSPSDPSTGGHVTPASTAGTQTPTPTLGGPHAAAGFAGSAALSLRREAGRARAARDGPISRSASASSSQDEMAFVPVAAGVGEGRNRGGAQLLGSSPGTAGRFRMGLPPRPADGAAAPGGDRRRPLRAGSFKLSMLPRTDPPDAAPAERAAVSGVEVGTGLADLSNAPGSRAPRRRQTAAGDNPVGAPLYEVAADPRACGAPLAIAHALAPAGPVDVSASLDPRAMDSVDLGVRVAGQPQRVATHRRGPSDPVVASLAASLATPREVEEEGDGFARGSSLRPLYQGLGNVGVESPVGPAAWAGVGARSGVAMGASPRYGVRAAAPTADGAARDLRSESEGGTGSEDGRVQGAEDRDGGARPGFPEWAVQGMPAPVSPNARSRRHSRKASRGGDGSGHASIIVGSYGASPASKGPASRCGWQRPRAPQSTLATSSSLIARMSLASLAWAVLVHSGCAPAYEANRTRGRDLTLLVRTQVADQHIGTRPPPEPRGHTDDGGEGSRRPERDPRTSRWRSGRRGSTERHQLSGAFGTGRRGVVGPCIRARGHGWPAKPLWQPSLGAAPCGLPSLSPQRRPGGAFWRSSCREWARGYPRCQQQGPVRGLAPFPSVSGGCRGRAAGHTAPPRGAAERGRWEGGEGACRCGGCRGPWGHGPVGVWQVAGEGSGEVGEFGEGERGLGGGRTGRGRPGDADGKSGAARRGRRERRF